MHFTVRAVPPAEFDALGRGDARRRRRRSTRAGYAALARQSQRRHALHLSAASSRACSTRSCSQQLPPGPGPQLERGAGRDDSPQARRTDMLGKLELGRDPVRPADPADRLGRRRRGDPAGVLAWIVVKGYLPYLWREWITSVDHKRIGVMYIVLALVMLLRGFADAHHDALAAGAGAASRRATCRPSTTTRSSRRTARS